MLFCGFSTARLRKFFKFRGLVVVLLVLFSVMLVLRGRDILTSLSPRDSNDADIIWQDSSGKINDASASGSGHKKEKKLQTMKPPLLDESTRSAEIHEKEIVARTRSEEKMIVFKDKSYLEIIDEANPSHSLQNDVNHHVDKLKKFTQIMNEKLTVYNKDKFPRRPKHGPVIVVQVHKRLEYLVHLISSLEKAKGVKDILLIISSDWYSDAIVNAVKQIKFCQVMHIFFPFAEQLHPDSYPGTDPNDCPRDISREGAKERKCNNAEFPDQYGHFREAKFTMTKHHWWWKANVVFDKLKVTRTSKGPFVFLEEDHYVAPDFFHSLNLLHKLKQSDSRCQGNCDILNLGMYVKTENYFSLSKNQVSLTHWRSYDHNMGMTMYRDTWKRIKDCSNVFCTYDDYNWDWTLMYISLFCSKSPFKALSIDLPRIFHIGQCGMHHEGECDTQGIVKSYQDLIEQNTGAFFVQEFKIVNMEDGSSHVGVQNGGWGDKRDHKLCESFVKKN